MSEMDNLRGGGGSLTFTKWGWIKGMGGNFAFRVWIKVSSLDETGRYDF